MIKEKEFAMEREEPLYSDTLVSQTRERFLQDGVQMKPIRHRLVNKIFAFALFLVKLISHQCLSMPAVMSSGKVHRMLEPYSRQNHSSLQYVCGRIFKCERGELSVQGGHRYPFYV